ncbi:putative RNA-directed DNA polymerase from transposon BS [Trichonephila clavipes]|nr:putative RNA-directed DNA polymerase from transposon BS [Trichonephila clavipes]
MDNLKPSNEETNAIISDNGHVSVDAREAAEALPQHYANESRLAFSSYDKHFARVTKNQIASLDISCPTLEFWVGKDCYTYVTSWKTGKLPRQWKSAIVIPIHKPNKNAGLTTSYRPISLTCITWKLMECMVLRRLTHHLHTNNLMHSEQFAFRKGHSTVDQILYFTQRVRDSQNHKPTRHTMAAFLDVLKAFDRVWRYKLLSKCFVVFGIKADDVVLWCSDANISKMEPQLNRSLVNIQEFADNHKITFNGSKSTVSLFTTNRHLYNYSPEIFLIRERLNYSKYPTYLGFSLDSEVNCGKHIEKIADKARKRLKILKYLSGRDWGSDASTLIE